jgi:hypothetical protein
MTHEEFTYLVEILRNVTFYVKIAPFINALILIVSMIVYLCGSELAATFCDIMVYTSPIMVIFLIVLSNTLKLCIWHRVECSLPLLFIGTFVVDTFIVELTNIAAYVNICVILVVLILSLFNAYKMFIEPAWNQTIILKAS